MTQVGRGNSRAAHAGLIPVLTAPGGVNNRHASVVKVKALAAAVLNSIVTR